MWSYVTGFFRSASCFQGSSNTVVPVDICSVWLLNDIPFYEFHIFVYVSVDGYLNAF